MRAARLVKYWSRCSSSSGAQRQSYCDERERKRSEQHKVMHDFEKSTTHRRCLECVIVVAQIVQVLNQRSHNIGQAAGDGAWIEIGAAHLARHGTNADVLRVLAHLPHQAQVTNPLALRRT